MSCRLGARTPVASKVTGRPVRPPHRVPGPPGGLGLPRACARVRVFPPRPRGGALETQGRAPCGGFPRRSAVPGQRPHSPWRPPEARALRRGGPESRGRARPVRRPEGKGRSVPSPRGPWRLQKDLLDPAVWPACHLAPSNPGSREKKANQSREKNYQTKNVRRHRKEE